MVNIFDKGFYHCYSNPFSFITKRHTKHNHTITTKLHLSQTLLYSTEEELEYNQLTLVVNTCFNEWIKGGNGLFKITLPSVLFV